MLSSQFSVAVDDLAQSLVKSNGASFAVGYLSQILQEVFEDLPEDKKRDWIFEMKKANEAFYET